MQTQVKRWGKGSGARFSQEFLHQAGISTDDFLKAEIVNGRIILTPVFRRRSLRERAEAYGRQLNLSAEMEREEPVGTEVW